MAKFEEDIKKCTSLDQVFKVVNTYYNTTEKMGILSGSIVKSKIPDIVKLLNLKPR